jgi:hypothetical protein
MEDPRMARTYLHFAPLPSRRHGKRRYDWDQIVMALREHPGEWALVLLSVPTSTAHTIRARRIKALQLDDGVIAATIRESRNSIGNVWARFVPTDQGPG